MKKIDRTLPPAVIKRNDKKATLLIWIVSIAVFAAVAFLANVKFNFKPGFNPHIFALANAIINSIVAVLLVAAFIAIKNNRVYLHKKLMIIAIILSVIFLVSYICHHLLAGETRFGDLNHDNILSPDEKLRVGSSRYIY
jgi:putative membrane protein